MNRQPSVFFTASALLLACAVNASAAPGTIPLRSEVGACVYSGDATRTLEAGYGTAIATLPFSRTATYDFYSPPLSAAVSLAQNDKAGGVIELENTSADKANDFAVTGRMQYFDYDPATGKESLIVDTTASPHRHVKHGKQVKLNLPGALLGADTTIPAGHLLHLALTVGLVWGNPGSFGQILYNGPSGSTTVGLLPQDGSVSWPFADLTTPPAAGITLTGSPVSAGSTGNTASVPDTAGAAYIWTIENGAITAGQGTSQITWTAGLSGSVNLGVTVAKGCVSTGSASANVSSPLLQQVPMQITSLAPQPDKTMGLSCAGTPGATYLIQATTNLTAPQWITISTNQADANGRFSFIDQDAANHSCRFYRTSTP